VLSPFTKKFYKKVFKFKNYGVGKKQ